MTGQHCDKVDEFETWSRRGSRAPLPRALRSHASDCAECGAFLADVEGLRETFASLDAPRVSEHRFDEMRFALMAEARKAQQENALPPPRPLPSKPAPRRPLPRWLAFAAAAALLLTGLAWASGQLPAFSLLPSAPPAPVVETSGRPGPRGTLALDAPTGQPPPFEPPSSDSSRADATPPVLPPAPESQTLNGATPRRSVDQRARANAKVPAPTGPAPGTIAVPTPKAVTPDATPSRSDASAPKADAASTASGGASAPPPQYDVAFRGAWKLLHEGKAADAAQAFDTLSRQPGLDPGRRADTLYWAARAHQQAGNLGSAQARAEQLTEANPTAWHAPQAALMMGEGLARKGDIAGARRWLERARSSGHAEVRARAEALLAELAAK